MALFFGCNKWHSYCIITPNSNNPTATPYCYTIEKNHSTCLCFSPHPTGVPQHCNIILSLTVFQKKIMVMELLIKSLPTKICLKNICHETKFVSISQQPLYHKKQIRLQLLQRSGNGFVQEKNWKHYISYL